MWYKMALRWPIPTGKRDILISLEKVISKSTVDAATFLVSSSKVSQKPLKGTRTLVPTLKLYKKKQFNRCIYAEKRHPSNIHTCIYIYIYIYIYSTYIVFIIYLHTCYFIPISVINSTFKNQLSINVNSNFSNCF